MVNDFKQKLDAIFEKKDNSERTIKNKPKGTPIGEWMKCSNGGKSPCDGKYYGWSHRAVYGFGVGDHVKEDSLGNYKGKEYTINDEEEARKTAEHFRDEVS
jgi:hypothetical protein